jgi:hypothetical protein
MIIEYLGESVKDYDSFVTQRLSTLPVCPFCEHGCHRHGCYLRGVREGNGVVMLSIQRVWCQVCSVTHAILPSFLSPYGRYPVRAREAVVTEQGEGVAVEEAGTLAGQTVETSKRWLSAFRRVIPSVLGALRAALAQRGIYPVACHTAPLQELASLCTLWFKAHQEGVAISSGTIFARANCILSQEAARLWL